ncbi:MAG: hypothetical protein GXP10_00055 [Gammaproteobacteria bacterium]|nr:hypothetical protein [Gammaproteobacteria bacterium]
MPTLGTPFKTALLLSCALLLLHGCAQLPPQVFDADTWLYDATHPSAQTHSTISDPAIIQHAPLIVAQRTDQAFNRIGQPVVEGRGGELTISIGDDAAMFVERRDFQTTRGQYSNLIYRIHFSEVPLPFHLTAGKNSGLLFIVTVNGSGEPLLLTTVHTCGCYLAFFPTDYLPRAQWPDGWPQHRQQVFGKIVPSHLQYQRSDGRIAIVLSADTHRVVDAKVVVDALPFERRAMALLPMQRLRQLLYGSGTVSMFEERGWRRHYVKGSIKPWELLLMSWWTFDLWVGSDKDYGTSDADSGLFYTALAPWHQRASDMRDFPRFLTFWGWGL